MNVGDPTNASVNQGVVAGVGYAHSSDENRKDKTGSSEGALL